MIAKIIAYGQDRKEALARLQRVLRESVVVIKGGTSNKAFLLDLLNRAEVQRAEVDIGWLDRLAANDGHCSRSVRRCGAGTGGHRSLLRRVGGGADAVLCLRRPRTATRSQ